MKTMVFALSLCGMGFAGKGTGAASGQEVAVYVVENAHVPQTLMVRATAEASEMFARIGVRVEWKAGRPHAEQDCRPVLVLTMEGTAPQHLAPGVHGFTNVDTGSITVFYDRIRPMLDNWPSLAPDFLAHVLAHEIGHALQGVSQHSETGIMKAHWTVGDYHEMQDRRMRFTPLDMGLIRAGIWHSCPAMTME